MNHSIFIVKVISEPIHLNYENEYETMEIKVQFPALRQKNFKNELTLLLWGEYRSDFLKYYKIQDYLIVEGALTLLNTKSSDAEVKIIVKRLYPFLLV